MSFYGTKRGIYINVPGLHDFDEKYKYNNELDLTTFLYDIIDNCFIN